MTPFRYSSGGLRGREADLGSSLGLRVDRLSEHLAACRLDVFEGTFAEIEPDFDAFVSRFTAFRALDATTLRYGRWLNPIGYWDWWELGGRFNGAITGEPRPAASEHTISSGPSSGRALLTDILETLGGSEPDEKAQIETNVELLESLAERAEQRRDSRLPTAVVLPTDYCSDEDRWFDCVEWHDIKAATRTALGVSIDADFATLVSATYSRLPNHAVLVWHIISETTPPPRVRAPAEGSAI